MCPLENSQVPNWPKVIIRLKSRICVMHPGPAFSVHIPQNGSRMEVKMKITDVSSKNFRNKCTLLLSKREKMRNKMSAT